MTSTSTKSFRRATEVGVGEVSKNGYPSPLIVLSLSCPCSLTRRTPVTPWVPEAAPQEVTDTSTLLEELECCRGTTSTPVSSST